MYRPMKKVVAAAMAAVACGCAGQPGSKTAEAVPAARAAVPAADCIKPNLQPLELEKTDYRFRMVGGTYKVTSDTRDIDVVVNKHGLDPHQIDVQPSRLGPNVARGVITVTDEANGCAFAFTVIVQK
jgi:hypothetical protein